MHWLTWREITELFRTWQGVGVAATGVIAALYYGPQKILETWDWYVNRFHDEAVLDVLKEQSLLASELRPKPVEGYSVGELSKILHRTHPSIGKSLQRLKRKGRVELYRGGFRLKE